MKNYRVWSGAIAAGALCVAVVAQDWVPFVIPAQLPAPAWQAQPPVPITTSSPRISVRGDHFYRGGERVRFFGVNCAFGANLPSAEEAPLIAARLAALGINNVRLHHMDTGAFPGGLWRANANQRELDEEALRRLDGFIDALAKQGISVDLNLHVGRDFARALSMPPPGTDMGKIVSLFVPEFIQLQKDFARTLLNRVSTVRGVRYADDPAVALVEITNEDSFFMWNGDEKTRGFGEPYAGELRRQWNAWLLQKYAGTEKLRAAWGVGGEPLGASLLQPLAASGAWQQEQHNGCRMTVAPEQHAGRAACAVKVVQHDETEWHLQLNHVGLRIEKGRYYTIRFAACATQPRKLYLGVGQHHEPWNNLGVYQNVKLTTGWQEFSIGFEATASDANARLTLALGGSARDVFLSGVELRPGGREGLRADEAPDRGTVALFAGAETAARSTDRTAFLVATEKNFFDDMRDFVRRDLKCAAPVTGTIIFGEHGKAAQLGMDFIDSHAYWQHPRFPHRDWDMNDWLIEQKALTDEPAHSTFNYMDKDRAPGKPFTVTEYNHPAPNDFQAECVPLLLAWAAQRDVDGIWLYTYAHAAASKGMDTLNSFFDVRENPAKLGFMPLAPAIYRDTGAPASVDWTKGRCAARGANWKIWTGKISCDELRVQSPAFASAALTALDGQPLEKSKRVLLAACGRCENTDMGFSADRRTVGLRWGHAPVRIEAVRGLLKLPGIEWRGQALDADGRPVRDVPARSVGNAIQFTLAPESATLWYLFTR
ncbi:MAG: carbohydrate binding domain-containing protein [Kiritimatiellaeota bacterium]|nr:carbohydrate binding domain-containing protein [Kiritimatiellota bacterium]